MSHERPSTPITQPGGVAAARPRSRGWPAVVEALGSGLAAVVAVVGGLVGVALALVGIATVYGQMQLRLTTVEKTVADHLADTKDQHKARDAELGAIRDSVTALREAHGDRLKSLEDHYGEIEKKLDRIEHALGADK